MAGIRPAEFWELTWSELAVFVKASERLEWQRWRRTAQLASWTTAPHLKRPVPADRLVPDWREPQPVEAPDPKRIKQALNRYGFSSNTQG
jgi:hypothetical protein